MKKRRPITPPKPLVDHKDYMADPIALALSGVWKSFNGLMSSVGGGSIVHYEISRSYDGAAIHYAERMAREATSLAEAIKKRTVY